MKKSAFKKTVDLRTPRARILLSKREATPFLAERPLRVTLGSALALLLLASRGIAAFLSVLLPLAARSPVFSRPFAVIPVSFTTVIASELLSLLFLFPLLLGANGYLYATTNGERFPEHTLFLFYTDKDLRLFSVVLYLRILLSLGIFSGASLLLSFAARAVASGLSETRATIVLLTAIVGWIFLLAIFLLDLLSLYPTVGEILRGRTDPFRKIFFRANQRMKGKRLMLIRLFLSFPVRLLLILVSGGLLMPFLLPRMMVAASLLETSFADRQTDTEENARDDT